MDIQEREVFEVEFSKIKSDIAFWVNTWDEDMQGYNHPVMCWFWHIWQAAKAQAVPEWISVEDRMPEQGQKVLVFRPDAHNHPYKDPNFKICTYAGADIFINSHFEHTITHWKPITAPVEVKEPAND